MKNGPCVCVYTDDYFDGAQTYVIPLKRKLTPVEFSAMQSLCRDYFDGKEDFEYCTQESSFDERNVVSDRILRDLREEFVKCLAK